MRNFKGMKFSRFSIHTTTVKQSQLVSAKDQTLSPVRIVTGIKCMYWQKIPGHQFWAWPILTPFIPSLLLLYP